MNSSKFDALTSGLAASTSRRSIVLGLIGGGVGAVAFGAGKTQAARPEKIMLCHSAGRGSSSYKLISVPENALAAHLAHGDFEAYDCAAGWSCEPCSAVCGRQQLFNCGPGYRCPTRATTFCPGGLLDPTSSVQALAACEACFGVGECVLITADCSGASWVVDFAPDSEPLGQPAFGYETGFCDPGNPQPPGRVYFAGASDPVSDYGFWGLEICPE